VATEAAWLDGNNLEKEELQKKKEKMKEKVWHSPAFSWKDFSPWVSRGTWNPVKIALQHREGRDRCIIASW
jgi:hypothetical protein